MAPSQTLKWIEDGFNPSEQNVEIEGTEPYIVGGHTASGYWVDTFRRTTIKGLFAAGDVSGGCPQKYVTGALVEGEISAETAIKDLQNFELKEVKFDEFIKSKKIDFEKILNNNAKNKYSIEDLEEAMQKIMDNYAGGISTNYQYNSSQLKIANEKIENLEKMLCFLSAKDMHELLFIQELKERLVICKVVILHLNERKETRWHSFAENLDYPEKNDDWLKYINSKMENGKLKVVSRPLVFRGDIYEHRNK